MELLDDCGRKTAKTAPDIRPAPMQFIWMDRKKGQTRARIENVGQNSRIGPNSNIANAQENSKTWPPMRECAKFDKWAQIRLIEIDKSKLKKWT